MTATARSRRPRASRRIPWATALLALGPIGATLSAQTADWTLTQGALLGEVGVGYDVAGVGDLDADGSADLVATAYDWPVRYFALSGRDGRVLFAAGIAPGQPSTILAPPRAAAAGDVNADGHADFIIPAPVAGSPGAFELHVLSGLHGGLLLTLPAGSFAGVGDVNGDGHDDVATGHKYSVGVHSGADGSLLLDIPSDTTSGVTVFGSEVAAAGDADDDGHPDIAVRGHKLFADHFIRVYSGSTGALIMAMQDPELVWNAQGHPTLARYGDRDGDGHDDLLVCGRTLATGNRAALVSGADGSLLQLFSDPALDGFGGVAVAGDADGDGHAEVAVGSAFGAEDDGRVTVFRASDGSILSSFHAPMPSPGFGTALAGLDDVTGDGIGDLAVAVGTAQAVAPPSARAVHVYSGAGVPVANLAGAGFAATPLTALPVLTARSDFETDSEFLLTLTNAGSSVPAWMVLGTSVSPWPGKPYALQTAPGVVVPIPIGIQGTGTLSLRWPAPGVIPFPELFIQAWIFDPPHAVSNVLRVEPP